MDRKQEKLSIFRVEVNFQRSRRRGSNTRGRQIILPSGEGWREEGNSDEERALTINGTCILPLGMYCSSGF